MSNRRSDVCDNIIRFAIVCSGEKRYNKSRSDFIIMLMTTKRVFINLNCVYSFNNIDLRQLIRGYHMVIMISVTITSQSGIMLYIMLILRYYYTNVNLLTFELYLKHYCYYFNPMQPSSLWPRLKFSFFFIYLFINQSTYKLKIQWEQR